MDSQLHASTAVPGQSGSQPAGEPHDPGARVLFVRSQFRESTSQTHAPDQVALAPASNPMTMVSQQSQQPSTSSSQEGSSNLQEASQGGSSNSQETSQEGSGSLESSKGLGGSQRSSSKSKRGSRGKSSKSKGGSQGASKSRVATLMEDEQQTSDSQSSSTGQSDLMDIIGKELKHAVFEKQDLFRTLSKFQPPTASYFEDHLNRLLEAGLIKLPPPSSQPSSRSQSQASSATASPDLSRTVTSLPVPAPEATSFTRGYSEHLEVACIKEHHQEKFQSLRKIEKEEDSEKKTNVVEVGGGKDADEAEGGDLGRAEEAAKTERLRSVKEVEGDEGEVGTGKEEQGEKREKGKRTERSPGRIAEPWKWKNGMSEKDYYPIFEDLLNHITDTLVRNSPPNLVAKKMARSYDNKMVEGIGGAHRLKPDLLIFPPGFDPHRADNMHPKKNFSWREIELPVEAKLPSNATEMFEQAATYARATFAANFNRLLVIVVLLGTSNKKKTREGGTVEFVCFCRSGACFASPRICFLTHDGMLDLIRHWAYLLAIEEFTWKDRTVSEAGISINGGTLQYEWEGDIIYQLISLRGRATWVRKARLPPTLDDWVNSTVGKRKGKRPRSSGRAPELADLQRSDDARVDGCFAPPPKCLVVKDSWPLKSTVNEWEVWSCVEGFFGCPKLWGREVLGDTQKFLPSEASERGVAGGQTRVSPEERQHVRTYMESSGMSVGKGKAKFSIVEVFEALGHAFLGILALFEKGFLHRDISPGNIVILDSPEERQHLPKCLQETTISHLKAEAMKCLAVLIDTDHAAKLDGSNQVNQGPATGTFNFMSCRLTEAFAKRYHTSVVHTLLDDLESLLWVLTYFIWSKLPPQHVDSIFSVLWKYRGTDPMDAKKETFLKRSSEGLHPRDSVPPYCRELVSKGLTPLFKVAKVAGERLFRLLEEEEWSPSDMSSLLNEIVAEYEKVWFDPQVKAAFASAPV